jgi:hypothetical protein
MLNAEELAEATGNYLEFKRLTGFSALLGEALLTVAIAEYLRARAWDFSIESNLKEIGAIKATERTGYLSCDLDAHRDGQHLAIEVKFLKTQRSKKLDQSSLPIDSEIMYASTTALERLTDDIIKLSYVDGSDWTRFLVIGRNRSTKLHDWLESIQDEVPIIFEGATIKEGSPVRPLTPSRRLATRIENEFDRCLPNPAWLKRMAESQCGRTVISIFEIKND